MGKRSLLALGAVLILGSAAYYIIFMGSPGYEDTETHIVTSTAFDDGGTIPVLYTRDGNNVSPKIAWRSVPEETQSIALTCVDIDGHGVSFTYWVIFNIPLG